MRKIVLLMAFLLSFTCSKRRQLICEGDDYLSGIRMHGGL